MGYCVERFRVAFKARLEEDEEFREAVANLHGSVLGCWCRRLNDDRPLCHGEVIAEHAHRLARSLHRKVIGMSKDDLFWVECINGGKEYPIEDEIGREDFPNEQSTAASAVRSTMCSFNAADESIITRGR